MSKKKSYMSVSNLLSEGTFSYLFNLLKLGKKAKNKALTSKEKQLLKDPSFSRALKKFDKDYNDFKKHSEKVRKKLGLPSSPL